MKRFLIITQVFPPDPAAVGQYLSEAAQALKHAGHEVKVMTANRGYDHPDEIYPSKELAEGVEIQRLKFSSLGKANLAVRILAQLSFSIQCILRGLFTPRLSDLLVSTSPPMVSICAVIIGFLRPRLKVHYWVMDINPDQAIAMGKFGGRHPLVVAMDWLNRRILKRADSVITLDRFMKARLEKKLESPKDELRAPIQVIPPWPMDDHLDPVAHAENPFRKAQGWEDKFVVMYSGNHSIVHPLDTILDAAEKLADDPRFVFAFIGGGKGKEIVDRRIASENHATGNLVSLPYQPLDQIRYTLSAADLHLVSLGKNMSGIVHPCKVYGAMAIGRPVLALGPSESYLNDIIERENFGESIEHSDVDAAVAALKAAADQTQPEREAIGLRAQQIATKNFARKQLIQQFLETALEA